MKVTINRSGGYDPRLGRDHPENQDQTLEAHSIMMVNRGMAYVAPHRWLCSCGKHGTWRAQIGSARNGAGTMKHEAALLNHGTLWAWRCSCGRTSRHSLPSHAADRNAKAHAYKYNKQVNVVAGCCPRFMWGDGTHDLNCKQAGEARKVGAGNAGVE